MSANSPWPWRIELFIRSLIGLALAPVAAGAFAGLVLGIFVVPTLPAEQFGKNGMLDEFGFALFAGPAMGAGVGIPWSLAAGWPIHLVLLWRRKTHILVYGLAGMLVAIAALFVLTITPSENDTFSLAFTWASAAYAGVAGLAGGAVFWLIRRPDRPAPIAPAAQQPVEAMHP